MDGERFVHLGVIVQLYGANVPAFGYLFFLAAVGMSLAVRTYLAYAGSSKVRGVVAIVGVIAAVAPAAVAACASGFPADTAVLLMPFPVVLVMLTLATWSQRSAKCSEVAKTTAAS